ncbi:hypothetical protein [Clostridium tyrobutyricum]|uniref:hypothetical protein n=1 Tax=Clostridium tyrobutyricum TaxID=1519 RepID=UPI001C3950D6|nr:hypothetical protein [Clostridium tyrobutyricum]MBV4429299.1 hypothetical protein [Clostridium tyrobutyricum]MBV4444497.1 hypothetical protein [Clostridium tyrobutyricum]
MMFKRRSIPLFKCRVVHSIPGRIRVGCRALKYLKEFNCRIERNLINSSAVKTAHISKYRIK